MIRLSEVPTLWALSMERMGFWGGPQPPENTSQAIRNGGHGVFLLPIKN